MYIVGQYKIYLCSLRNRRKARQSLALRPVSKSHTNKFYIFWQHTYIVNNNSLFNSSLSTHLKLEIMIMKIRRFDMIANETTMRVTLGHPTVFYHEENWFLCCQVLKILAWQNVKWIKQNKPAAWFKTKHIWQITITDNHNNLIWDKLIKNVVGLNIFVILSLTLNSIITAQHKN